MLYVCLIHYIQTVQIDVQFTFHKMKKLALDKPIACLP